MTWQRFDPEAHTVPHITVHAAGGEVVNLADWRGQYQVVLFFAHGPDCAACRTLAERFAAMADDLQTFDTRMLAVTAAEASTLPGSAVGAVRWLADPDGAARERCVRLLGRPVDPGGVVLLVLDQFGSPYAAWSGADADAAGLDQQTLEWVAYIAIQCPE